MNFQAIQLDESAALKANSSGGMFFDGNSEQLVKIVRAEFTTSEKGTTGISFDVYNQDKQKGYFTLWYLKANGERIEGFYNQLQNLMAVCGVNTLTPTAANISKYSHDAGREVPTQMTVANELMGKYFVGLFINEFEIYNGEKKTKTQLFTAFNQNRQSLQEQRDQAPPQQIEVQKERMISYSQKSEKEADAKMGGGGAHGGYGSQPPSQGQGVSYQRTPPQQQTQPQGMPQQSNYSAPPMPQHNQAPTSMPAGPVDDDIPFNKHFDGQF